MSNLTPRDKRALRIVVPSIGLFLLMQYWAMPAWDNLQIMRKEIPQLEQTFVKYRQALALSGELTQESKDLAERLKQAEGYLLHASTSSLAAAELDGIIKNIAQMEGIELKSTTFPRPVEGDEDYLQIPVSIEFQCRVEQLVNLLSAIQATSTAVSVSRMVIAPAGGSQKMVSASMTLSGWVKPNVISTVQ